MAFETSTRMKKIVLFVTLLSTVLAACHDITGKKKKRAYLLPRNHRINKKNAYNNIFMDSMAVEQYFRQQKTDEDLANRIRNFYNVRNYEFAWMDRNGLTEQGMGFHSLYHCQPDSDKPDKILETRVDNLMSEDSPWVAPNDPGRIKTELMLTQKFLHYASAKVQQWPRHPETLIPSQKMTARQLADSILADKSSNNDEANPALAELKKQLKKYLQIAANGGWTQIPVEEKKYKKGTEDAVVVLLRKRLRATGELQENDSASAVFDEALDTAVRAFQASHGYTPTGVVTPGLLKEMNVPVQNRIQQLLLNMQRARWLPSFMKGKLILVNIPEFVLHVRENNNKVFDMPVIVGKEGHNTTMFYGDLNEIVFSPYWNLPSGIVRREILPAMEDNKDYLANHNMEIVGERNGVPVIRQLPGGSNALGKVKFLFPNSFNIYFHDTPSKELFNRDKRAYSHGCIRLSDPVKLAQYLLQGRPGWTAPKIDSAMNSSKERYVELKQPVPVIITYLTAWVDENGTLQLREDIYGHDDQLAKKLLVNPVLNKPQPDTLPAKKT